MFLPMMGFLFALAGLGCLLLLAATVNRRFPPLTPKPLVPYLGFICLFAALGASCLSVALGMLGDMVLKSQGLGFLGFFAGYILGGCGGVALGFWKASGFSRSR